MIDVKKSRALEFDEMSPTAHFCFSQDEELLVIGQDELLIIVRIGSLNEFFSDKEYKVEG